MLRYLGIFLLLVGCQMSPEKSTNETANPVANSASKKIESKIETIESRISEFKIGNSLAYINNDQSTEEVFAYLDSKGAIVKLEEKFFDAKTQNLGVRYFFLEKGKRIASRELIVDKKNHNGLFLERVSYYNSSNKPFFTKERVSEYEEDIEKQSFSQVDNFDCSLKTAMMVLNQQGPFQTTFQGFFANGPLDYLIVGGPGENDYTSSLLVQYEDSQVAFLKKNEVRMIGSPLVVDFEKMMDQQNFEFQILLKVQIMSE